MTFAAFDFLAGIKAAWAAGLGGLDRLAVDHTGRRAGLAALRPAGAPQENVVEPQPHLTGAPGIEVALHRSVGPKLLGQQTPLAAGLGQIEYRTTTARSGVVRVRPRLGAGGISTAIIAPSPSVVSLAYRSPSRRYF